MNEKWLTVITSFLNQTTLEKQFFHFSLHFVWLRDFLIPRIVPYTDTIDTLITFEGKDRNTELSEIFLQGNIYVVYKGKKS